MSEATDLLGSSFAITQIREGLPHVSKAERPVLIRGEQGTGKQLIAQILHAKSRRRNRRLIIFNCESIRVELLEGKLFGEMREDGHPSSGSIDEAADGVLVIEHVELLGTDSQASLLSVISSKELYRKNSTESEKCDVWIIATVEKDLRVLAAEGSFNRSLAEDLSGVEIYVPPLRDRLEDLPDLVEYFVGLSSSATGQKPPIISSDFLKELARAQWPGNVGELETRVTTSILLSQEGTLDARALPESVLKRDPSALDELYHAFKSNASAGYKNFISSLELHVLERALVEHNYNQAAVAREFNLTEGAVRYKMKQLGLPNKSARLKARREVAQDG